MDPILESDEGNDGVPTAVNPENQSNHSAHADFDPLNVLSESTITQFAANNHKRHANDDPLGETKRAKSEHGSPPAPLAYTITRPSTAPAEATLSIAEDAQRLNTDTKPVDIIPSNTIKSSSPRQPQSPLVGLVSPPIPLDAIDTLNKTSIYLRMAIMNKDAPDRENHLLVAIGNLKSCLDQHFVPHLSAPGMFRSFL